MVFQYGFQICFAIVETLRKQALLTKKAKFRISETLKSKPTVKI